MQWPGHRFALTLFASVIAIWLVIMFAVMRDAALPANANGVMMVVFEPSSNENMNFKAITDAGARPIRKTSFGFIWVVEGNAGALEKQGALGSYRELPISAEIAGCVAVADAKVAKAFGL
jgi:hypothetical protein